MLKYCVTCKIQKENASINFCKNKNTIDGTSDQCKICTKNNRESKYLSNRKRSLQLNGKNILLAEHNSKCFYCEVNLIQGINLHLDHKVPLSKNGEHSISNLVPACITCNLQKGTKSVQEFLEQIGKL